MSDYSDIQRTYYNAFLRGNLTPVAAETLANYIVFGMPPGGFMTAVLANDLVGAFGRADMYNVDRMQWYAKAIYNSIPSQAWGSYGKVQQWIASGGIEGQDAIADAEVMK
jgi:hypothetical protein